MKGLTTLAVFALLYLAIIIIFKEASAEPRGVEENVGQSGSEKLDASEERPQPPKSAVKDENQGNGTNKSSAGNGAKKSPKFGSVSSDATNKEKGDFPKLTSGRQAPESNQKNDSNPLADLFQITDPNMRTTMASIYGAYQGNDQCSRKAFCMLGNYMKDMPGRDLIFLMMGSYIPPQYSLYYEIFKAAVIYGQNCNVYVCTPDAESQQPEPVNAANAARPKNPQPASATNGKNAFYPESNSNSFPR